MQEVLYELVEADRLLRARRSMAETAAVRQVEAFADPSAAVEWGGNAMRLMFRPRGLRPHIVNGEAMAAAQIQWLHRDVFAAPDSKRARVNGRYYF